MDTFSPYHIMLCKWYKKLFSSILLVLQVLRSLVSLVAQVKYVVCQEVRKAILKRGWVSQIVYFKLGLNSSFVNIDAHFFKIF